VLRARSRRLAKLIGRDGVIESYDDAKHFDMTEIPVDGLDHLEDDLRRLLHQPDHCIVRGQIADDVRDIGTLNDPDEQRARLDVIARNLDVLQRAVTCPTPRAALQYILSHHTGSAEQQSKAAE
jgi:hypothetical protein